jgi:hypothetical protein
MKSVSTTLRRVLIACALITACERGPPPTRTLVFDCEPGDEPWYADSGNVRGEVSLRKARIHRHGRGFVGTGETADGLWDIARAGVLRSPAFVVAQPYLVFRMGGRGSVEDCWLELRAVGGDPARRKIPNTGRSPMETHVVDVGDRLGTSVELLLVDRGDGEPCSIHIDWVRLVDG